MRAAPTDRRARGGRPSPALPSAVALALFAALALAPTRASAAEDEVIIAVEPGWGTFSAGGDARHAVGGSISAWAGITELLWLAGSAGGLHVLGEAPAGGADLWEAYGGLVAALDVLRVVPFFEAELGVTGRAGALAPGLRLGVGADYLVRPTVSLGGVVRWRSLTEDVAESSLLTAELRLAVRLEL